MYIAALQKQSGTSTNEVVSIESHTFCPVSCVYAAANITIAFALTAQASEQPDIATTSIRSGLENLFSRPSALTALTTALAAHNA